MGNASRQLYAGRRARFLAEIGEAVAILPGAPETVRSNDVHHRYHQHPDFYYLTGFTEPGAFLVLDGKNPKKPYSLFVQPKNPDMERWTGRRVGLRAARSRFAADQAEEAGEFFNALPGLLKGHEQVYLRLGDHPKVDEAVIAHMATLRGRNRAGDAGLEQICDPTPLLGELRLFKSPEEVELLQTALDITADGHLAAMAVAKPGVYEYQVEAELYHRFRRAGATGEAYPTICGSGVNATILHYIENDRRMRRGELLLIDAGAEYQGYAGDVTRTLPIGGRYSDAQRAAYNVVLAANRAAIKRVRPGVTFDAVHQTALKALCEGLIRLGLLSGTVQQVIKSESYRRFYMHRTSHWLGLDVHDVGRYHDANGRSRKLEPGMVLTIEPGLYIDPAKDIPKEFHNIGIRIEDDVLVTEGAPRVLSAAIPKSPDDIERVMAGN